MFVDEPGITLFAFHGKLNEPMDGLEAGIWSRDITKAKNGYWTFYDKNAKLKIGDTIYFWTTVHFSDDGEPPRGYRQDNGEFKVEGM